jgi:hypothetical protein
MSPVRASVKKRGDVSFVVVVPQPSALVCPSPRCGDSFVNPRLHKEGEASFWLTGNDQKETSP